MRKIRYILIMILTVGIIVLGAFLPTAIVKVQDRIKNDGAMSGDLKTVNIDFNSVSTLQKLILTAGFSTGVVDGSIDISEDRASKTREEIKKEVIDQLTAYVEAGLMPEEILNSTFEASPVLVYNMASTEMSNIFWVVLMGFASDYSSNIELIVDDSTGAIFLINCAFSKYIYGISDIESRLIAFYNIYFDSLEQKTGDAIFSTAVVAPKEMDVDSDTRGAIGTVYYWGDIEYGEIALEFYISTSGFCQILYTH